MLWTTLSLPSLAAAKTRSNKACDGLMLARILSLSGNQLLSTESSVSSRSASVVRQKQC